MNKVFYAKMRKENEIINKTFTAPKSYYNGVDVGDYAFIKPKDQVISELWKATNWTNDNSTLKFELVAQFDDKISLKQFVSLKLFKLDINLLNKTSKHTRNICFFELQLTDGAFDIISDRSNIINYVKTETNYRKLIIRNSRNDVQNDSKDVQIYLDNGTYQLHSVDFIDYDSIIDKFNGNNFQNGKSSGGQKGILYNLINSNANIITKDDVSLIAFYDLFISNNDTTKNKRIDFINWLRDNGVSSAINQYDNGLRAIEKKYNINIDEEYKKDACKELLNDIQNDSEVIQSKKSKRQNKRNWSSYLKKYISYKESLAITKKVETSDKQEICVADKDKEDFNRINLNPNLKDFLHLNTIFYGVPGCGKSYYVKQLLKYEDGNDLPEKYFKRILFHPEYSYSDFVGQILPESNGDKIGYNFQAGPFVEMLENAIKDAEHEYFLIIEEINRGNAPAIFGDIFQLLDRGEDGQSEYKIYNKDIVKWLKDKNVLSTSQQIYIPSNLTILATMNTSDQNVFTIDTAFKRRWRMMRIKNDFDTNDDILNTLIKIGNIEFTWKSFATALNADIIENCNDGTIAEDKLLGTHFVKKYELNNGQIFAEKVFMYLWNDVVRYNKEQLFANIKTLDELIDRFLKGENVFNNNCIKLNDLYIDATTTSNLSNNQINSDNTDE